jgi:SAM-dependent methyltransferase
VTAGDEEVVWHDAECGSYDGDLALWERLCAEHGGPVLELGAGTGRLSLHLARRGYEVVAVELNRTLAETLRQRAGDESLPVEVVVADARTLELERRFPLVLASMQFVQLFLSPDERRSVLGACGRLLESDGVLAVAIVDGSPEAADDAEADDVEPLLPDVREVGDVVYASQPVSSVIRDGVIESERRRRLVWPSGEMTDARHVDRLALLDAASLGAEAAQVGLRAVGTDAIAPTDLHVGSRVVLFERSG